MNHIIEFSCSYNKDPSILKCDNHKIRIVGKFEKVEFHVSLNLHLKWCYEETNITSCEIEKNVLEASKQDLKNLKQFLSCQVMFIGAAEIYDEIATLYDNNIRTIVIVKSTLTGEKFLCKAYKKPVGEYQFLQETKILNKLSNCKNIVQLYEVYESKHNYYMIMEGMSHKLEQDYTHEENQVILRDILLILQQLQENNIVHGQIKPSNFMFDRKNTLKLIGFSKARIFDNPDNTDISSVAKIMLYLYNHSEKSVNQDFSHYPNIPGHGTNLLKGLLNNTQYRMNLKQVMSHPYFKCDEMDHQIVTEQMQPKFKHSFNNFQ